MDRIRAQTQNSWTITKNGQLTLAVFEGPFWRVLLHPYFGALFILGPFFGVLFATPKRAPWSVAHFEFGPYADYNISFSPPYIAGGYSQQIGFDFSKV